MGEAIKKESEDDMNLSPMERQMDAIKKAGGRIN